MGKKAFLIDVARCTGCDLCIVACKDEHVDNAYPPWTRPQPTIGHFWMKLLRRERGTLPKVRMSYLPLLCQHCENAPCIKACPSDAIRRRDDGLVWIDPERCAGSGLCLDACPYGVVYMNVEAGIAQKCTGCAHRIDQGLEPRCVGVCPHDAILFGDDEDDALASGSDGQLEVFHPEFLTQPRVLWRGLPRPFVSGSVVDSEGEEVVAGADVALVDLLRDRRLEASTDEFGDFWFEGLEEAGKYRLEVIKEGYRTWRGVVSTDRDKNVGEIFIERGPG